MIEDSFIERRVLADIRALAESFPCTIVETTDTTLGPHGVIIDLEDDREGSGIDLATRLRASANLAGRTSAELDRLMGHHDEWWDELNEQGRCGLT